MADNQAGSAPPNYAFEARSLHKFFVGRNPVQALSDINLQFKEGSFTCIVGPSGCGKSTLLRILGGLETYTSGELKVSLPDSKVPKSAFVFQEHGVFPWFNVLENVAFGERMAGVGKAQRQRNAREWIRRAGLQSFEDSYPQQLSGGMRQRIAIARAFATGSPALLMDEPLGALDSQTRTLMQEQLVDLWEQERKTVVLVTHSIEEALLLGDEIVMMSARPGRVKEVIEVPFGRPRGLEIEKDPRFTEMKTAIWESMRDEVQATMGARS